MAFCRKKTEKCSGQHLDNKKRNERGEEKKKSFAYVGKSLTRRVAWKAAVRMVGSGIRSYAKTSLRPRRISREVRESSEKYS